MTSLPERITSLVEAELATVSDQRVLSQIRRLLVPPTVVQREWDYGYPGQTFPCWSVLNHPASNTGIAFCEFGFGPESPWGLVFLPGEAKMSIGMDAGWFPSFIQAFFDSAAATDLPIWRIFKQVDDDISGIALTEEGEWDATWEKVRELRVADPQSRYHCSQSIYRSE